jgi:hypothetical protein
MENLGNFVLFVVYPAIALLLVAAVGLPLYIFGKDTKTVNIGLVLVAVPLGICVFVYFAFAVIPAWFR